MQQASGTAVHVNSDFPEVIVLRGAPGVGKSSTAKCLATLFSRGAKVEVDLVRKMVNAVDWTNQQEHIRMLDVAAGLVHNLASEGYLPVLVVDTFSGNKIKRFLEVLRGLQPARTFQIFALHAAEDVLRQRLLERPADGFKDFDISRRLNADVSSARDPRERLIDSSMLEPAEIARAIYEELADSGCNAVKALAADNATAR